MRFRLVLGGDIQANLMTKFVTDKTVSKARRNLLIEEAPLLKSRIGKLFPDFSPSTNFDVLYELLTSHPNSEIPPKFSKTDLEDFLKFLKYPHRETVKGSERGPHYLTFFQVVLNNFIRSFEVIKDAPNSFYENVIDRRFEAFYYSAKQIEQVIREYDSPMLSPEYLRRDLIEYFKDKDGRVRISESQIINETDTAATGLVDSNPIYAVLMFPFISDPRSRVNLDTYFFILGALVNVVLAYPTDKRFSTIFLDLRKVQQPLLDHLAAINFNPMNYEELIVLLRKEPIEGFNKLANIISSIVFPRAPAKVKTGKSKGGTKTGKSPYNVIEFNSPSLREITPPSVDDFDGIKFYSLLSNIDVDELERDKEYLIELDEVEEELLDHNETYIEVRSTSSLNLDQNSRNIKQAANALQNYSQFLINAPTPSEFQTLFDRLAIERLQEFVQENENRDSDVIVQTDKNPIKSADLAVRINFIISLLTGRRLSEEQNTYYLRDSLSQKRFSHAFMILTKDCSYLKIPITSTKALIKQDVYESIEHLKLPIPQTAAKLLRELIDGLLVFEKGDEDYILIKSSGAEARELIPTTLDKRITPAYLSNYLRNSLKKLARDQDWIVQVISGDSLGLSTVQSHYTASFGEQIFQTYQKYIKLIFNEKVTYPPIAKLAVSKVYGNPNRVRLSIIRLFLDEVRQLLQSYGVFAEGALSELATQDLVACYNLATVWFETYLSLSTGGRNITNSYIYSESISQEGFAPLNDKNIHDGYTARQVYVYKTVREHQVEYEVFAVKILKELVEREVLGKGNLLSEKLKNTSKFRFESLLVNKDKDYYEYFPGFVILEQDKRQWLKVLPYTRKPAKENLKTLELQHLEDEKKEQFFDLLDRFTALPANSNRRFLRSMLLDIGNLNGNHLDNLMGHQNHGRESWNPYSTFNTPEFIKAVQEAYVLIWKNIKITPLFELGGGK